MRVGLKVVENPVIDIDYALKRANPALAQKDTVLKAIVGGDLPKEREISDFFFRVSGIYARLIRHLANFYRYDWYITPYVKNDKSSDKVVQEFNHALAYLDNFGVKRFLGEAALKVIRRGAYYGYIIYDDDRPIIQELPENYCRSRMFIKGKPVVEFNMKFFNDFYRNAEVRLKILNAFPDEFKKGYKKFIEGELPPQFSGDTAGWYPLDPEYTVKFNINSEDFPMFMSVIPHIIDLDEAQETAPPRS